MTEQEKVLEQTRNFVRQELEKDSSGHDWFHIERVTNNVKLIAQREGGNTFICELAALLHDVADEKLNESKEAGQAKLLNFVDSLGLDQETREDVLYIIERVSFSGGHNKPMETLEGQIVQDADRLDALGAIGIARTFMYAGSTGGSMHDPELPPRENLSKEEYRKGKSTAVNHFYEKLLKLKDLMNTPTGKQLAEERHRYMEGFLEQFKAEWDGQR